MGESPRILTQTAQVPQPLMVPHQTTHHLPLGLLQLYDMVGTLVSCPARFGIVSNPSPESTVDFVSETVIHYCWVSCLWAAHRQFQRNHHVAHGAAS
jgi:hypothetical protein